MKLLSKLQHSFDFWFLLIASFLFFLMRLPSFFEPYWYGDEGVYEVLGFGMRHGRLLYSGIWDNKPPLLYLIYALFDGNQVYTRIFSFVVGLVAVFLFFLLCKKLFQNKKSVFVATGFFTLFLGLPFVEGNIANAENFMVLPIIAGLLLLVKTLQGKKSFIIFFASGLLLGISFLLKIVGIFDFSTACVLTAFTTFALNKNALRETFFRLVEISFGFLLPFVATVGFFASRGILKTFIQSAFASNVGYVNYGNQLIIPQGFLILKLLLLGIFLLSLFIKRKSLSFTQLFIYTWLAFSLFNAFFSGRPYTHYVLTLLGSLSLLAGLLLEKQLKKLHSILFAAVILLIASNFWFYAKTPFYYINFAMYLSGIKSTSSYQSFFDNGVPRDYAIADFLKTTLQKNDNVFLWTNSAQIYYLIGRNPIGRYTVAYHMTTNATTLNETALALRTSKPRFVIILPNATSFPFKMNDYRLKVQIQDGLIYERIL